MTFILETRAAALHPYRGGPIGWNSSMTLAVFVLRQLNAIDALRCNHHEYDRVDNVKA